MLDTMPQPVIATRFLAVISVDSQEYWHRRFPGLIRPEGAAPSECDGSARAHQKEDKLPRLWLTSRDVETLLTPSRLVPWASEFGQFGSHYPYFLLPRDLYE
jgi:hypothetical protein